MFEVEEEEDRGGNRVAHIAISDDCVQLRKQGAWAAGENRNTKRMLVIINTMRMLIILKIQSECWLL